MSYLDTKQIECELNELRSLQIDAKIASEKYHEKKKELMDKGYTFEVDTCWNSWIISVEYEEYVSATF